MYRLYYNGTVTILSFVTIDLITGCATPVPCLMVTIDGYRGSISVFGIGSIDGFISEADIKLRWKCPANR